jgi:5-methylcytosine-specific restriction endonuclease McrA
MTWDAEDQAEYCRKWRVENKAILRNQKIRRRIEVIKILGGKCAVCGIKDYRVLEIDHIIPLNLGRRRKGLDRSSDYTYRHIIETGNTDNLQLLCANCHTIKTLYQKEN